ncbi:VOC family protein, partial [Rhodococcus sp. G-MC3]|uniref:VOC family protein n=1 Tax=Rhodococcus sp. G-MC3 TaxID=3046209 RepID=UPI0024BA4457
MTLHRLDSIVLGVPDLVSATAFYEDFGLTHVGEHRFATQEGSIQLSLVATPTRRLVTASFAVDDTDDLARVQRSLTSLGFRAARTAERLSTIEPATGTEIDLVVSPRLVQHPFIAAAVNAPGRIDRVNARADGALLETRIKPRRLGHIVLGTPNFDASHQFFVHALGFKISDIVKGEGVFLRCSTDHHNILIQRAPMAFMHHSSWQVDDID